MSLNQLVLGFVLMVLNFPGIVFTLSAHKIRLLEYDSGRLMFEIPDHRLPIAEFRFIAL
jgi:hypothetical protein